MSRTPYSWNLPAEIEARLGRTSWGAQRAIFEAGHLLLVLHAPPAADGNEREHEVFLRLPGGKLLYKGREQGEQALAGVLDDYQKRLDALETQSEKAHEINALFAVLEALIPLARSAGNARAALQSARELWGDDSLLITQRDRAVEIARGFELLLADARLALEFRLARSAEEQTRAAEAGNRAQHKLNILAAIAFPLMSVSAVFGVNLHSGLENQHVLVFWLVFLGGLGLGLFVKGWVSAAAPERQLKASRKH